MIVANFMTPDPVTVGPNDSLETALQAMDEYSVRHLPVVDDGDYLVGVLSHRDLVGLTGWGLLGPEEGNDDRVQWVSQAMATEDMPTGVMLQIVVDDADAFAEHARGNGLEPQGPMDAHGERIYFLTAPSGLAVSFQSKTAEPED